MSFDSSSDRRSSSGSLSGSLSDSDFVRIKPISFEEELQVRLRHLASLCRSWKKRYLALKAQNDNISKAFCLNQVEFKRTIAALKMETSTKLKSLEEKILQVEEKKCEIVREKATLETAFKKTLEQNRVGVNRWQEHLKEKETRIKQLEDSLEEQRRSLTAKMNESASKNEEIRQLKSCNERLENTLEEISRKFLPAEGEEIRSDKSPQAEYNAEYKLLYELALHKLQVYETAFGRNLPFSTNGQRIYKGASTGDQDVFLASSASSLRSFRSVRSNASQSSSHDFTSRLRLSSRFECHDGSSLSSSSSPTDSPVVCSPREKSNDVSVSKANQPNVAQKPTSSGAEEAEAPEPDQENVWCRRRSLSQSDISLLDETESTEGRKTLNTNSGMPLHLLEAQQSSVPTTPTREMSPSSMPSRSSSTRLPGSRNRASTLSYSGSSASTMSAPNKTTELSYSCSRASTMSDTRALASADPRGRASTMSSSAALSAFDSLTYRRNGIVNISPMELAESLKMRRSKSKDFVDRFKRFHFSHKEHKDKDLTIKNGDKSQTNKKQAEEEEVKPWGKPTGFRRLSRKKASSAKV